MPQDRDVVGRTAGDDEKVPHVPPIRRFGGHGGSDATRPMAPHPHRVTVTLTEQVADQPVDQPLPGDVVPDQVADGQQPEIDGRLTDLGGFARLGREGIDLLLEAARHLIVDMGRTDVHFGLVGGVTLRIPEFKMAAHAQQQCVARDVGGGRG